VAADRTSVLAPFVITGPFGAALCELASEAEAVGGLGLGHMSTAAILLAAFLCLVAYTATRTVDATAAMRASAQRHRSAGDPGRAADASAHIGFPGRRQTANMVGDPIGGT
jgi:hypothetical protein